MYLNYKKEKDFVGMDMCRKFLEMGFTRARRYANHRDGKKYDKFRNIKPQEKDALTCECIRLLWFYSAIWIIFITIFVICITSCSGKSHF